MKAAFLRLVNGLQRQFFTVDKLAGPTPAPEEIGAIVSTNDAGFVDPSLLNASATPGPNKIVQLDASGRINASMMPTGYGDEVGSATASEALAAGDYVNLYAGAGGVTLARRADASAGDGKLATGFVLEGFAQGAIARVFLEGLNGQVSGRTPGAVQFLSATEPGKAVERDQLTTTPGHAVQIVGTAVSQSAVTFEPQPTTIL